MSKNKSKEFIYRTFLSLTSKTCPHIYEDKFYNHVLKDLFANLMSDEWGNFFTKIGTSRTIFASHIDTVSREYVNINHVFDGDYIRTDGKTILGADDKAGVSIMLWMIHNKIPGLYYFFSGEEVGCIGSKLAAKNLRLDGLYDRIISFDRRGTNSIITYQSYTRSCSDQFADSLCSELNRYGLKYEKDEDGIYTDSAEFVDVIPECTNISVGYYKEHTVNEYQDIKHLIKLADACIRVDWENLVTDRDKSKTEYRYSNYRSTYTPSAEWEYEDDGDTRTWTKSLNNNWNNRNFDDDYDEIWNQFDKKKKNGKRIIDKDEYTIILPPTNKSNYGWIIDKFESDRLTLEELEKIKDCYFNMNDHFDRSYYNDLKSQLIVNHLCFPEWDSAEKLKK
jgi:hypothetical protein